MRVCSKCGASRPPADYYRNPRRRDGLFAWCKQCHLAICRRRNERDPDYLARWRANNPDAHRRWYQANKEKRAAYNLRYREINRARLSAAFSSWARNNSDRVNARIARRLAAKRNATPLWSIPFFVGEAYSLAKLRDRVVGGKWHVDHVVPLRSRIVCGLHAHTNLRVVPSFENQSKGNRQWPDMP